MIGEDGRGVGEEAPGMESAAREIVLVVLVALGGVALAGVVVLAPWHPAHASVIDVVSPPAVP
jgi:hypothetical protein